MGQVFVLFSGLEPDRTNWPVMDPADSVCQALANQGAKIGQLYQVARILFDSNQAMSASVIELSNQMSTLAFVVQDRLSSGSTDSHVSDPEPFDGDINKCWGYLLQCKLVFSQRPAVFPAEASRISYMLGLLSDRALSWAKAVSSQNDFCTQPFAIFEDNLRIV